MELSGAMANEAHVQPFGFIQHQLELDPKPSNGDDSDDNGAMNRTVWEVDAVRIY